MYAYVQIINDKVTTVYACPQDPSDKPGYCELSDDDPRIEAFYNSVEVASFNANIDAQIIELEAKQARPIREVTLAMAMMQTPDVSTIARIHSIEDQIRELRSQRKTV